MHQERIRLQTKIREELRSVDPKSAVLFHLKDMWRTQPTPNMDDLETVGTVVSNIYSDDDDYLIVTPTCYILVGKNASVNYGDFDGYSSGNKSRKQIIDGLTRTEEYTIYKITQQYEDNFKRPIVTLLTIESVDVVSRKIKSLGFEFNIDEIDIDRKSNTFVVKELFFDGLQYYTKSGNIVKNIIPRKVTMLNESDSTIPGIDSGEIHESVEQQGQGTSEESTE